MRILCQCVCGFDILATGSNNAHMHEVDFSTRLRELFQRDVRIPKKTDGSINVAQAAAVTDFGQPTLKRMLDGESELPSRANALKLMKFLGVTFGQLIGTEPIEDGDKVTKIAENQLGSLADARFLATRLTPEQVNEFMRPLVKHMSEDSRLELIGMIAQPMLSDD